MSSQPFNPTTDIPSLSNKVIFITGGTAGLGAGSITELAKHSPAHIYFSGRSQSKADALISHLQQTSPSIPVTFIQCDISSLSSVHAAAQTFASQSPRLDILMLNAGIMATPPGQSAQGYEIQFATNYLGHALLVKKLLPTLLATSRSGHDVRVISTTSIAYKQAPSPGISFATLQTPQPTLGTLPRWARYGQSKLAQLLYTTQLATHHPEITSVSIHPGYIMTGLFDDVPLMTKLPFLILSLGRKMKVEEGHWHQCWAATCEKTRLRNGGYYEPMGILTTPTTKAGNDVELAAELWKWTQKELQGW